MIKVSEYAESRGVSSQAIRAQVLRYKNELEGHTEIKGKSRYLDDFAVSFLDGHRDNRKSGGFKVVSPDFMEENQHLKDELDKSRDKIIELQEQIIKMGEAQAKAAGLLTIHAKTEADLKAAQDRATAAENALREVQGKAQADINQAKAEATVAIAQRDKAEEQAAKAKADQETAAAAREQAEKRAVEAEKELDRLRNRSFFARLFNR